MLLTENSTRTIMVLRLTSCNKKILFQSASVFIFLLRLSGKSYQSVVVPVRQTRLTLLNSPHVNRTSQKQFYSSAYKITFMFFFDKKENFFQYLLFLFLTNAGTGFSIRVIS